MGCLLNRSESPSFSVVMWIITDDMQWSGTEIIHLHLHLITKIFIVRAKTEFLNIAMRFESACQIQW